MRRIEFDGDWLLTKHVHSGGSSGEDHCFVGWMWGAYCDDVHPGGEDLIDRREAGRNSIFRCGFRCFHTIHITDCADFRAGDCLNCFDVVSADCTATDNADFPDLVGHYFFPRSSSLVKAVSLVVKITAADSAIAPMMNPATASQPFHAYRAVAMVGAKPTMIRPSWLPIAMPV
ncbi:hypothetical protein cgR_2541 [Corynebacterium glutamicum R]|uniref:Uncharacterized protein n=1 Tax=Corynebacterium glutamicum (strain R) TaxID=340322 RepID=A0AB72VDQ1_CORGB|nr:hypothetical protein cgR_2541 [Corynebacterium glutamicum R]